MFPLTAVAGARDTPPTSWEVKALFCDWLEMHYSLRAQHVMRRVQAVRGGRDNDPEFGSRMRGTGEFALV